MSELSRDQLTAPQLRQRVRDGATPTAVGVQTVGLGLPVTPRPIAPAAIIALQRSSGNAAVARMIASERSVARTPDPAPSGSNPLGPKPAAVARPLWLDGVWARHVEGEVWEVEFRVGGPHLVGPYDELAAYVKRIGLAAD